MKSVYGPLLIGALCLILMVHSTSAQDKKAMEQIMLPKASNVLTLFQLKQDAENLQPYVPNPEQASEAEKKLKALEKKLRPILCVGEKLEDLEVGQHVRLVLRGPARRRHDAGQQLVQHDLLVACRLLHLCF